MKALNLKIARAEMRARLGLRDADARHRDGDGRPPSARSQRRREAALRRAGITPMNQEA